MLVDGLLMEQSDSDPLALLAGEGWLGRALSGWPCDPHTRTCMLAWSQSASATGILSSRAPQVGWTWGKVWRRQASSSWTTLAVGCLCFLGRRGNRA